MVSLPPLRNLPSKFSGSAAGEIPGPSCMLKLRYPTFCPPIPPIILVHKPVQEGMDPCCNLSYLSTCWRLFVQSQKLERLVSLSGLLHQWLMLGNNQSKNAAVLELEWFLSWCAEHLTLTQWSQPAGNAIRVRLWDKFPTHLTWCLQ